MTHPRRLVVCPTGLGGLVSVERLAVQDSRGTFARVFCAAELLAVGWDRPIAQINHSVTQRQGTIRGMHFQRPPAAEAKLVSCLGGAVFDVAVDLRPGSATFGQWHGLMISAENRLALLIPQGFAHGFQALTDGAALLYLHSEAYDPELEGGIQPLDPELGIAWPLSVTEISSRDSSLPRLRDLPGGRA